MTVPGRKRSIKAAAANGRCAGDADALLHAAEDFAWQPGGGVSHQGFRIAEVEKTKERKYRPRVVIAFYRACFVNLLYKYRAVRNP
jgi:hypothetical protein